MLSDKKQKELRERLPYGVYIGADGRETLFNRKYEPMVTRASVNDVPTPCKPDTWIEHKEQGFFFTDYDSPFYTHDKRNRQSKKNCESVLVAFESGEPIDMFIKNWIVK